MRLNYGDAVQSEKHVILARSVIVVTRASRVEVNPIFYDVL